MEKLFDIHRDLLESHLHKTSRDTPIKIKFKGSINTTKVYIKHFYNGKFWVYDKGYSDIPIWPSRKVEIISIGQLTVQSNESYQEEKAIYKEYLKMQKQELIKQAYKHEKQLGGTK